MPVQEPSSICNTYENNVSKIINRMEKHLPVHLQMYSDMYREYLHTLDDVFGACMVAESTFEKMLPLQGFFEYVKPYADGMTDTWIKYMDDFDSYLKWYTQMRIAYMKSYDESVHARIDPYSAMLAGISKSYNMPGEGAR